MSSSLFSSLPDGAQVWIHPADAPNPRVPAHERPPEWPAVDDYAVIVMQSLERIVLASHQLMGTPYYQSFSPQGMQHVEQRHTMLDTWHSLTDGPSYNVHDERAISAAEQGVYQ
jgi:hypothetical protein